MKHCVHFPRCGGCSTLDQPYETQVAVKERHVTELFSALCPAVLPIEKSPVIYYYRHKIQLPFGFEGTARHGQPILGCYAKDSHAVVNQKMCHVQDRDCSKIAWVVRDWVKKTGLPTYNERTGKGFFRHVLLRRAAGSGEILIGLVTNGKLREGSRSLARILLGMIEKIKLVNSTVVGIVQNNNTRDTNVVLGSEEVSWWGRGYIKEKLGDLRFKIGLSTFFQVNPYQTPNLYNAVLKQIPQGAHVLDCYCGVGTIALWVAHRCSRVTGIEENGESVKAARVAAKLNEITNATFVHGGVHSALSKFPAEGYSCMIVDPPRKGIGEEMARSVMDSGVERIVYVSCNPQSLKSDAETLSGTFRMVSVQPFDMFPHTEHIECVAVFERH